jgi:hypothetical protein
MQIYLVTLMNGTLGHTNMQIYLQTPKLGTLHTDSSTTITSFSNAPCSLLFLVSYKYTHLSPIGIYSTLNTAAYISEFSTLFIHGTVRRAVLEKLRRLAHCHVSWAANDMNPESIRSPMIWARFLSINRSEPHYDVNQNFATIGPSCH